MIENPNVICNNCGFGKQNKELEDKCERLEKQLKIADSYLQVIVGLKGGKCFQCVDFARRARKKIKELEK